MALKVARVPAYGVKVTNSLKNKVVGRAYLYVMTNDLHHPSGCWRTCLLSPIIGAAKLAPSSSSA